LSVGFHLDLFLTLKELLLLLKALSFKTIGVLDSVDELPFLT